jgi:hypothetical protein
LPNTGEHVAQLSFISEVTQDEVRYLHNAPVFIVENLEPQPIVVVPYLGDAPERSECCLHDSLDLVVCPHGRHLTV